MATALQRAAAIALVAGSGLGLAHHGWSSYDAGRTLNLAGTVREVGSEGSHVTIRLEVGTGNTRKVWLAILSPASRMELRGQPVNALKAGVQATVVGYPHRTVADEMRAERITLGSKTTELR